MKDGSKASLEIDNPVATQVFGLFIGHALQRILGLHHRDSVPEALKIFRQTALICAAKEPIGKFLRIIGRKIRILRLSPTRSQFAAAARHPDARARGLWEDSAAILYQVSWMESTLVAAGAGARNVAR